MKKLTPTNGSRGGRSWLVGHARDRSGPGGGRMTEREMKLNNHVLSEEQSERLDYWLERIDPSYVSLFGTSQGLKAYMIDRGRGEHFVLLGGKPVVA